MPIQRTVILTGAQIISSQATPVMIIPAPPAGKVIILQGASLKFVHGTVNFSAATQFQIRYTDASGQNAATTHTFHIENAADAVAIAEPDVTTDAFLMSAVGGEPIVIRSTVAVTGGNGILEVTLWYYIV